MYGLSPMVGGFSNAPSNNPPIDNNYPLRLFIEVPKYRDLYLSTVDIEVRIYNS